MLVFIVVLAFLGCTGCNAEKTKNISVNIQDGADLIIEPGENLQSKMNIFVFSVNKTPQIALWIEDSGGNYIKTVMVTDKGAKKSWMGNPKGGRPEALPVWYHKIQSNSVKTDIDAVSAATPKETVKARINEDLLITGNTYNAYLEINQSFDYNDFWTEKNSGVNGQPSLIYYAKFTAGQSGKINLAPIGYGSVDGSNGKITDGTKNFTTALTIIKEAYIIK
jgi:hypothetical protein